MMSFSGFIDSRAIPLNVCSEAVLPCLTRSRLVSSKQRNCALKVLGNKSMLEKCGDKLNAHDDGAGDACSGWADLRLVMLILIVEEPDSVARKVPRLATGTNSRHLRAPARQPRPWQIRSCTSCLRRCALSRCLSPPLSLPPGWAGYPYQVARHSAHPTILPLHPEAWFPTLLRMS